MAHPLALQLRNLQSLVEIGVDKNTTVVFPAPLMSTIEELGNFLAREQAAGSLRPAPGPRRGTGGGRPRRQRSARRRRLRHPAPVMSPPAPTERFAQHPRLAEPVNALCPALRCPVAEW